MSDLSVKICQNDNEILDFFREVKNKLLEKYLKYGTLSSFFSFVSIICRYIFLPKSSIFYVKIVFFLGVHTFKNVWAAYWHYLLCMSMASMLCAWHFCMHLVYKDYKAQVVPSIFSLLLMMIYVFVYIKVVLCNMLAEFG